MPVLIANFAFFQFGWLAGIFYGNVVLFVVAPILVIHHFRIMSDRRSEWLGIISISVIGILWDSLMSYVNILNFPDETGFLNVPYWLAALWLLFATTYAHSLKWLSKRLLLSSLIASVAGPLTYLSGLKLIEGKLGEPAWASVLTLAVGWAIMLPTGLLICEYFKQRGRTAS